MNDVVSPDGKWRWDGKDWTANTPAEYKPGDIANGHVLGADGQWHPVGGASQKVTFDEKTGLFHGTLPQLLRLAVAAVQRCGWTVTQANDTVGLLTFETKMSWGSFSGITCSISIQEVENGWYSVSGTGKQNVRGGQLGAFDFGESQGKVMKVVRTMRELALS